MQAKFKDVEVACAKLHGVIFNKVAVLKYTVLTVFNQGVTPKIRTQNVQICDTDSPPTQMNLITRMDLCNKETPRT